MGWVVNGRKSDSRLAGVWDSLPNPAVMMSRKRRANRGHLIFVFCIELATRQSIIAYVLSCLMQAEADAISESSSLAPFCHNAMLDFAALALLCAAAPDPKRASVAALARRGKRQELRTSR